MDKTESPDGGKHFTAPLLLARQMFGKELLHVQLRYSLEGPCPVNLAL